MDKFDIPNTKEEWKKILASEEYDALREGGTEAPFTGKYVNTKEKGTYVCKACGNQLFSSYTKFDSSSGWPSFDKALPRAVKYVDDHSHGVRRIEVICAKCNSHLGHVFDDGPTFTGKRFCINSVCLTHNKDI